MSVNVDLSENSPERPPSNRSLSLIKMIIILAITIYLAEMIAMIVLYFVQIPNYIIASLVDGIIMVVLILPGLYFLQVKPIWNQIEKRNKAESALRSSEMLIARVLELLPVSVFITDKDGKVVQTNQAGKDLWGGVRYVDVPHYGEYKAWWADSGKPVQPEEWAAARAIANRETILNEEVNIEAFDGKHKVILNSAVPILDEQNDLQGAVILNQEITQRRQMERELTKTNELLERYFLSIDTLIAYMDRDFNFIRVNDTYAKAGGHPPEYFIDKNHFDLYANEENLAIFRRVVETGEQFTVLEKPFEYDEFPERGVTYWDWSLQPVKGNNGEVEGLVLSLVDVTENKRAQLQLEQKNQELQELSSAERRQRELAEGLVQASLILNKSLEMQEVLQVILEQIRKTVPFRGGSILLLEGRYLRLASYVGYEGTSEINLSVGKHFLLEDYPLVQQICESLQPMIIDSTAKHPDWRWTPGLEWVCSYLGVPLILNQRVIGIISLNSDREGGFTQEAVDHLLAFTAPAALALHNAILFKAESTARQLAETLSIAAQALTRTLEIEQVIDTLLDHIQLLIKSDTACVTLLEEGTRLSVRSVRGYGKWANQEKIAFFPIEHIDNPVVLQMILEQKSFTLSNVIPDSYQEERTGLEPVRNWLIVPIIASDKVIGLVELGRAGNESFTLELNQWVEGLVGQAAVAIQNAWLYQQVRSSSERLQSLARKLVEVQENERYWIARELHDEAGQSLSLLKLNLGRLGQDSDCPQHIRQKLEELKGATDSVLEELHRLAMDLRPVALDHLGLVAALEQFAKNLSSERLVVQFKALGFDRDRLPKDVETSLYRIAQEAIANVIRHAQACKVGILLECDEGKVKLFIEDDGIGFDPYALENKNRLGLVGMLERAEMLGGTLTIESHPGKGSAIIVEVPHVNSHPDSR